MEYKRLDFWQYFVDQSLGYQGGTPRFQVNYKKVEYECSSGHKHDAFYCVMYDQSRDVYQIYFKETYTKSQWKANFNFPVKYYDSFQYNGKDIQLRAASGWSELYCALKWYIRNELTELIRARGDREVEIIGWSLGSAIAQLCAQDLFFNYGIKAHVFTYGSVKPWGNCNANAKEYLKNCYQECYNFGDVNDVVSYLVPLPGYFKFNKVTVAQDKFSIIKLFKPLKYHCEYYKPELYQNIE